MKKLLVTLRLFRNYRLYSLVNIIGLALSLACVITISRYLYSELTVDSMHSKHHNIYAVLSQNMNSTGRNQSGCVNINNVDNFVDITLDPAVLIKTTILRSDEETVTADNRDYKTRVMVIDTAFTSVFDFTTTIGSLNDIERSVDKIAMTSQTASRMFGNDNPLGKTILIKSKTYTVAAILAEPTSKTSMDFDIIAPIGNWRDWMLMEHQYFVMPDNFDYKAFNDKYPNYNKLYRGSAGTRYMITPLNDLYFDRSITSWNKKMSPTGDKDSLNVIFAVALLVLIIGVFNFINIYTVLMLRRSREVGVKKVFGASTASITGTIYIENLMMVTLAIIVGWTVSLLCKDFTASTLGIPVIDNIGFNLTLTAAFIIVIPLLTTIYPYLKYRYTKPITSLREVGNNSRSIASRATFLVLQYSITIIMVIVSVYFVCQMNYIFNADLGYKHRDIIAANLFAEKESTIVKNDQEWKQREERTKQIKNNYKILCDELSKNPIVDRFSYNESPHEIQYDAFYRVKILPDGEFKSIALAGCNPDYFSMFDIEKVAGRLWSDSTDRFTQYLCIVNEAFLREFNIKDYTTASVQTSTRIWYSVENEEDQKLMEQNPPYTIVGVVRDFQIGHLKSKVPPLFLYYDGSANSEDIDPRYTRLMVQAAPGKTAEVIRLLEDLHSRLGTGEFIYTLVDDEIAQQYEEDRKVTNIYTTFAIIAIVIGSLGLFSLSLYDVQQRYREIAIRRVNGATVPLILSLLLRKYYILLSIAFVIASTCAYFLIEWYMQDFANRVELSWWIFALAAIITGAISLLTLIYQTVKAALTNPAIAMKAE